MVSDSPILLLLHRRQQGFGKCSPICTLLSTMAKPWVRLVTGSWQGLLPELQYGFGKMVCLGHHLHLSGGSNQFMAPSGDWSTPWEVNVAVEGYFDKDLKVMPLTTVQMRTTAVSACASH